MAWARIDDAFFNHPKVRKAGKDAVIFHMAALCYSNAFMTDGFIADEMLELIAVQAFQRKANGLADRLMECQLWDRVEGGYLIHDYLEYNYSRQQVEEIKSKRSEAGKQGGRPTESKIKANEKQNEKQNESKMETNSKQNESHTHTHINTNKDLNKPPLLYAHDELVDSVVKTYEQEIGKLTPAVMDDILTVIEDYPLEWFAEAFKEASRNNKPNWRYALAILKRWKVDGYKVDTRVKRAYNGSRPTKPPSAGLDEILDGAPIFAEDKK